MRIFFLYLLVTLIFTSCSVATFHQNSVNTPCFNNTNNYQIRAGFANRNFVAQIAAKPYKGFSFLANSSFSDYQNNNDFSFGYSRFRIFNTNLGIEGFIGAGFGNTNHQFEKNTYDWWWDKWHKTNYDITNKYYKICPQIHLYYSFENNIQLAVFARISSLYFSNYHTKSDFTDSTAFYDRNYPGLNAQILDIGITFKYELKHAGFFLQATYTNNNAKVKPSKDFGFQKKFPVFFGIGMSFYWNSFSRKATPTPMAH